MISVPSAPGANYVLLSTTTGAYIATTSSAIQTFPASPSGSIQYNDGGVFGGTANLTTDSGGNISSGGIATFSGSINSYTQVNVSTSYSGSTISMGDNGNGHPGIQNSYGALALQGGSSNGIDFYTDGGNTYGMSLDPSGNLQLSGKLYLPSGSTFLGLPASIVSDYGRFFISDNASNYANFGMDSNNSNFFFDATTVGFGVAFWTNDGSGDTRKMLIGAAGDIQTAQGTLDDGYANMNMVSMMFQLNGDRSGFKIGDDGGMHSSSFGGIYTGSNGGPVLQFKNYGSSDTILIDGGLGDIHLNGTLYLGNTGTSMQGLYGGTMAFDGSGNIQITPAGGATTITGTVTANTFATVGGSSTTFTKGDGSQDSTKYLPYKQSGAVVLVSGTKAVTISGITSSNRAFVTVSVTGGTLGTTYKAVCTTNTLTVTSVSAAGTTVVTDTSTLNYLII